MDPVTVYERLCAAQARIEAEHDQRGERIGVRAAFLALDEVVGPSSRNTWLEHCWINEQRATILVAIEDFYKEG